MSNNPLSHPTNITSVKKAIGSNDTTRLGISNLTTAGTLNLTNNEPMHNSSETNSSSNLLENLSPRKRSRYTIDIDSLSPIRQKEKRIQEELISNPSNLAHIFDSPVSHTHDKGSYPTREENRLSSLSYTSFTSPRYSLLNSAQIEIPSMDSPTEALPFEIRNQVKLLERCIERNFFIQHSWIHLISEFLLKGQIEEAYTLLDIISEQEDSRFNSGRYDLKYQIFDDKNYKQTTMTGLFEFFTFYLEHYFSPRIFELLNPVDFFMLVTASIIICHVVHFLGTNHPTPLYTLCAICHIYKTYCLPTIVRFFDPKFLQNILSSKTDRNNQSTNDRSSVRSSFNLILSKQRGVSINPTETGEPEISSLCDFPFFHLNVVSAYLVKVLPPFDQIQDPECVAFYPSNCSLSEYLNTALASYISIASTLYSSGIQSFEGIPSHRIKSRNKSFYIQPNSIPKYFDNSPRILRETNYSSSTPAHNMIPQRDIPIQQDIQTQHTSQALFDSLLDAFLNPKSLQHRRSSREQRVQPHLLQKPKHLNLFLDFLQCYLLNYQKQFLSFAIRFRKVHNEDSRLNSLDPINPSHIYSVYYSLWDTIIKHLDGNNTNHSDHTSSFIYMHPRASTGLYKLPPILEKSLRFALIQRSSIKIMSYYWTVIGSQQEVNPDSLKATYLENKLLLNECVDRLGLEVLEKKREDRNNAKFQIDETDEEQLQLDWMNYILELTYLSFLLKNRPSCIRTKSAFGNKTLEKLVGRDFQTPPKAPRLSTSVNSRKSDISSSFIGLHTHETNEDWAKQVDTHKFLLSEHLKIILSYFNSPFDIHGTNLIQDWMWFDKDEIWLQSLQIILYSMLVSGRRIHEMEDILRIHYPAVIELSQSRGGELSIVLAGWEVASYRISLLLHQFELGCVLTELCRWNYLFESFLSENEDQIITVIIELNICFLRLLLLTSSYPQAEIVAESIKKKVKMASGFPHYRSFCLMLIIDCLLYSSWLDSSITQYQHKRNRDDLKEERKLITELFPLATRHAFEALYHLMSQFHKATAIALHDLYTNIKAFSNQRKIVDSPEFETRFENHNSILTDTFVMQAIAVTLQAQFVLAEAIPLCSEFELYLSNSDNHISNKNEVASVERNINSNEIKSVVNTTQSKHSDAQLLSDLVYWLKTNSKKQLQWMIKAVYKLGHRELLASCYLLEVNLRSQKKVSINQLENKINLVFKYGGMNPYYKQKAAEALLENIELPNNDFSDCKKEYTQLTSVLSDQIKQIKSPQSEMWLLLKYVYEDALPDIANFNKDFLQPNS